MVAADHGPFGPRKPVRLPFSSTDSAGRAAAQWAGICQLWWSRAAGGNLLGDAARLRLDALVAHARRYSPLLRELYRDAPATPAPAELPVTRKRDLMERFDDWVTDAAVRRAGVDAFLADPSRVGQRYLGRYVVWQSSGTSAEQGIFVQDDLALQVYDSLIAVQMTTGRLASHCFAGLVKGAGCTDRRDIGTLREHRVVATRVPRGAGPRGTKLPDHNAGARARCKAQHVRARVPRRLSRNAAGARR